MDFYITNFETSQSKAVALEDSIMTKGNLTTAGSRMLENFVSPFNATVVERLRDAGFAISGKTRMTEFGITSIAPDKAPKKISGATQAVLGNAVPFCLCNDLFGQYRREAAENGLCYIHPTYGTVSRYGLIPLASSMDQIGVLCKTPEEGFSLLSTIAGRDTNDGAMFPEKQYDYKKDGKKLTLCVPSHIVNQTDERTRDGIRMLSEKFAVVDGTLEYFDVYKQAMYVLSSAEISNNINRYDGIKFGYRSPSFKNLEDLYTKTRTEAFGLETKLAAIMGAMVLSREQYVPYYEKAMKIRRLIKQSLQFDKYDVIILPLSTQSNSYENLSLYAVATLAGLPSISFSYNGCGIMLIANVKNENALFSAWEVTRS